MFYTLVFDQSERAQGPIYILKIINVILCTRIDHVKVHLPPKFFFAKTIKLILWSNMPQKFFDLVKSSNFCAPLKPGFVRFTNEHGESGESKAVRTNAYMARFRGSETCKVIAV